MFARAQGEIEIGEKKCLTDLSNLDINVFNTACPPSDLGKLKRNLCQPRHAVNKQWVSAEAPPEPTANYNISPQLSNLVNLN